MLLAAAATRRHTILQVLCYRIGRKWNLYISLKIKWKKNKFARECDEIATTTATTTKIARNGNIKLYTNIQTHIK